MKRLPSSAPPRTLKSEVKWGALIRNHCGGLIRPSSVSGSATLQVHHKNVEGQAWTRRTVAMLSSYLERLLRLCSLCLPGSCEPAPIFW